MYPLRTLIMMTVAIGMILGGSGAANAAVIWGGVAEAGGWSGAGARGEDEFGDDMEQDENQLTALGSASAAAQDEYLDVASSSLELGARHFRGTVNAVAAPGPDHDGEAWAWATGGVRGAFAVSGGSGVVEIPIAASGVFDLSGIGDISAVVSVAILDEGLNTIWEGSQGFDGEDGEFDMVYPLALELEEGEGYFYQISCNVEADARNYQSMKGYADYGQALAVFNASIGPDTGLPVPEPATVLLLTPGLVGLWAVSRLRRRARRS